MSAAEPLIPAEQRDAGESNAGDYDVGDFDPTAINAVSRDLFFFSLDERPHAVDRRARADRGEFMPPRGGSRDGRQRHANPRADSAARRLRQLPAPASAQPLRSAAMARCARPNSSTSASTPM